MLAAERRHYIYQYVKERGSASVTDLSTQFLVSEETIRRDLKRMEGSGILFRTHGGAFLGQGKHLALPISIREKTYVEGKDIIGSLCAEMIMNGDTVFLDVSTTAIHIAEKIMHKKNVVVVTNALKVALTLSEAESIRVILTGGILRQSILSTIGSSTITTIKGFFADKAFIGCDGIHFENGITDANDEESEIRKIMMQQADDIVLVADATKFGKTSFVRLADFGDIDILVTDKDVEEEWKTVFRDNGVEIYCKK